MINITLKINSFIFFIETNIINFIKKYKNSKLNKSLGARYNNLFRSKFPTYFLVNAKTNTFKRHKKVLKP